MMGIFGRLSFKFLAPEDERESYGFPKGVDPSVHGVQLIADFKPVEQTQEPSDKDNPIKCPQPQLSILHDGTILKERLQQANGARITELPVLKEDGTQLNVSLRRLHYNVCNDTVLKFPE